MTSLVTTDHTDGHGCRLQIRAHQWYPWLENLRTTLMGESGNVRRKT